MKKAFAGAPLMGLRSLLVLGMAMLGLACSDSASVANGASQSKAAGQSGPLQVSQAWARETPPTAEVGAGYFVIHNNSDQPVHLLGASSERAASIEIHNMTTQDGMMRMRHIDQVEIAPGQSAALAPGGDHLMLMGLSQPLVAGEELAITLHFAGDIDMPVTLKVRRDAPQ